MRIVLVLLLALWATQAEAATKCVNGATGSDATSYASNNGTSSCWQTIGRAAWGSTNRAAPNTGEAAQAGDTVNVAGGSYDYASTVTGPFDPVYLTANSGTAGNLITFTCVGDCVLTAPSANGPVIGANTRNYIKWYADISLGYSWQITACGRTDITCGAGTVNITPDTGPVVCSSSTGCWFEGLIIDGGDQLDYTDNYDALRFENATTPTVRNNAISNMRILSFSNAKAACIALYGTANGVFEHNTCTNAGGGVVFKDTGSTNTQSGNAIRFNRLTTIGECFSFSHVTGGSTEGQSNIYQNICDTADFGLRVIGATDDAIVNNTFVDVTTGVFSNQTPVGIRFWNNVCQPCETVHYYEVGTMPAQTIFDAEHNSANGFGATFYTGTDGNRTFASFTAAFTDQEQASPASITSDVLYANASGGDFRLCTAAGAPHVSCSGASPALALGVDLLDLDGDTSTVDNIPAGAYITNSETIGLDTDTIPPSSGPTRLRIRGEH